ncbi:diacylglycerol/polyprenol kinase family protein [Merismopedia glauca]|uniref:Phosphatidate cytidylyltransferase n=1 Tax=Merismopedia glauca CCAP 1448/3 TaxID=1296344 RepID=A0A2T1C7T7_9CYAN|nr:diacylglycerol/polyprenol kinase family protein [Merismopedia glauca]PSB04306.1 phosphatidate cytidylyltransferase [Merismopedia glauca CCAP 1448/3]
MDFIPIPDVWIHVCLVAAYLAIIVLVAELSHLYHLLNPEKVRKVVHIGTGNAILLAWWLDLPAWVAIAASAIASIIALISYKFPILPGVNSVGRQSFGTFFYGVSIGVLVAWFWNLNKPEYAAIGILVMAWGDGFAALIGQAFGTHPYTIGGMKKSWEGSLTMVVISYAIASSILWAIQGNIWQTWLVALAVALVATALEAFSRWGIDNLTVPLASAGVCWWLNQIWLS